MQERIEPPILISRIMTVVMATALVVLLVLVFTFDKMFPLNRPQVFFLTSQNLDNKELTLTKMPQNLEKYKENFVKEYIRERNEIVPDLAIMRAKWATDSSGVIKARSTDAVFGDFVMTDMFNIVRRDLDEAFDIKCRVEFPTHYPVVRTTNDKDTYRVSFAYICSYGSLDAQDYTKKYQILVKLQSDTANAIKWAERMENPLGIRVSGYKVVEGQDDPLNWVQETE